jgi:hypothetical protein
VRGVEICKQCMRGRRTQFAAEKRWYGMRRVRCDSRVVDNRDDELHKQTDRFPNCTTWQCTDRFRIGRYMASLQRLFDVPWWLRVLSVTSWASNAAVYRLPNDAKNLERFTSIHEIVSLNIEEKQVLSFLNAWKSKTCTVAVKSNMWTIAYYLHQNNECNYV